MKVRNLVLVQKGWDGKISEERARGPMKAEKGKNKRPLREASEEEEQTQTENSERGVGSTKRPDPRRHDQPPGVCFPRALAPTQLKLRLFGRSRGRR